MCMCTCEPAVLRSGQEKAVDTLSDSSSESIGEQYALFSMTDAEAVRMCAAVRTADARGRRPDGCCGRRWLVGKCALRRSGIKAGWIAQVWQDDAALSRVRTAIRIV